jgi:hypothetical protein
MALYEKLGFVRLKLVEGAWTMVKSLAPLAPSNKGADQNAGR